MVKQRVVRAKREQSVARQNGQNAARGDLVEAKDASANFHAAPESINWSHLDWESLKENQGLEKSFFGNSIVSFTGHVELTQTPERIPSPGFCESSPNLTWDQTNSDAFYDAYIEKTPGFAPSTVFNFGWGLYPGPKTTSDYYKDLPVDQSDAFNWLWEPQFPQHFKFGIDNAHFVDKERPTMPCPNCRSHSDPTARTSKRAATEDEPDNIKISRKQICYRNDMIDHSDDDEDVGSDYEIRSKDGALVFACPFYRRDPMRHLSCVNLRITRIRDVKQHILKRHATAFTYCPTCYQTFSSLKLRDDHIRYRRCTAPDPVHASATASRAPLVLSEDAQAYLKQPVDRSLRQDEQWYSIWKVLFKDEPPPRTPYAGTVVEETARMMRKFWKKDGPQITRSFIKSTRRAGPEEEHIERLVVDVLTEVHRRFKAEMKNSHLPINSAQSPLLAANNIVVVESGSGHEKISDVSACTNMPPLELGACAGIPIRKIEMNTPSGKLELGPDLFNATTATLKTDSHGYSSP